MLDCYLFYAHSHRLKYTSLFHQNDYSASVRFLCVSSWSSILWKHVFNFLCIFYSCIFLFPIDLSHSCDQRDVWIHIYEFVTHNSVIRAFHFDQWIDGRKHLILDWTVNWCPSVTLAKSSSRQPLEWVGVPYINFCRLPSICANLRVAISVQPS